MCFPPPPLTSIVQQHDEITEDDAQGSERADQLVSHDSTRVHFVGWLENLNPEEMRVMRRWLRRVSTFFPSSSPPMPSYRLGSELAISRFLKDCQYIAHPPYREDRDPVSGNLRAIWFSCAGFVIQCYEAAAVVRLVVPWTTAGFPLLTAEQIRNIWFPSWIKMTTEIAAALNLTGDGPWPVTVPGYVINAFWREDNLVRNEAYLPSPASVGIVSNT